MKKRWNKILLFASLCVMALYAVAAVAAWCGMLDMSTSDPLLSPRHGHILGTDTLGRDVLSLVIGGALPAIGVGVVSNVVAVAIGVVLGLVAAFGGRRMDAVVVWLYSVFENIPAFLFIIAISYFFGTGFFGMCAAVGLTTWTPLCRQVRMWLKKEKKEGYLLAADVAGASFFRKLRSHLIPSISGLLFADVLVRFSFAVKSEVVLSYLGLGISSGPSWGRMIAVAREELTAGAWWPFVSACAAVLLLVAAINTIGSELNENKRTQA